MILWYGVPIYRRLHYLWARQGDEASVVLWVYIAASLIQVGYWVSCAAFLRLDSIGNWCWGHAIQFIGRA